ncbi:ABC transporter permease subunit [Micromonospora sp. NPDC005707]|uniref:ABC transporter permease subunit n=1 Tax=Micromonospora sp. NPDC005707 TaxID=3157050 RepID=UPI0033F0D349
MLWLSWRQFRTQALVGVVALAPLAALLLFTGLDIRRAYDRYRSRCGVADRCLDAMSQFQDDYRTRLLLLALLLAVLPAVLGVFWGAPLIARELETGTQRLVWNQSVTRRRWLAVKLLVVGLGSVLVAALASLLLTWAASPYDEVSGERFGALAFGARNLTPVAYAALAFVLGAVAGLLVRRTVPAMALTVLAFTLLQLLMPNLVRPHLLAPVTVTRPMTAGALRELRGVGADATVKGLSVPDAWVTGTSKLLTAGGRPVDARTMDTCLTRPPRGAGDTADCLGALNLHVTVVYQPDSRYWSFQWIESAGCLALAGLLAGFGLWRIQRQVC